MPLVLLKSILAALLLGTGVAAAAAMLRLMGRADGIADPAAWRRFHRGAGFTVLGLLTALSALGAVLLRDAGDQLPLRIVLHYHLALAFWAVILVKIGIVRFYKGFLRMAPSLGLTMISLALVIVLAAAGTYALRSGRTAADAGPDEAARGARIFQARCEACHFADREEAKAGPGLKGLLRKATLPASGRPATVEGVEAQLKRPYRAMPAFPGMAGRDLADLIAYLRSL